jgi:hypothetical protein
MVISLPLLSTSTPHPGRRVILPYLAEAYIPPPGFHGLISTVKIIKKKLSNDIRIIFNAFNTTTVRGRQGRQKIILQKNAE